MDRYHIWFDLRPGIKDMDLAVSLRTMLDHLKGQGRIEGWELERRKLGFGPRDLGEWHVAVRVRDLAQLEDAFDEVTPRSGEMERMHASVWSKVQNFRSALYRDFPDPNRVHAVPERPEQREVA